MRSLIWIGAHSRDPLSVLCLRPRVRAGRRNVSVWIRCKCSIDSLIKTPQLLVSSWWRYQSLDISQLFRHSPCQPDETTPTNSTMAMSGVKLTEACKTLYDDIQKGKKYRWVCPGVHEYMSTVYSSHIQSGTESSTYPGEWSTWRRSGLARTTTRTSWWTSWRRTGRRTTVDLPVSCQLRAPSSP